MPPSKYALDENAKGEDVETSPSLAMIRHFAISSCLLWPRGRKNIRRAKNGSFGRDSATDENIPASPESKRK